MEEILPSIQIAALIIMMFWVMTDVMFKIIRLLFPVRPKVPKEPIVNNSVALGPVIPKDDFDIAAARRELGLDSANQASAHNPSAVIHGAVQAATLPKKTETNGDPPVSKPTLPKPRKKARKPVQNKKTIPMKESV